jgi:leucyl/phenylalanyl-tRNA--protein transferase
MGLKLVADVTAAAREFMKLFVSRRTTFGDPRHGLDQGIVDVSNDISVERLLEAYSFGIFPWPHDGFPILWFCPEQRGVLDFSDFHISRSLKKELKRDPYSYSFNQSFEKVIDHCARQKRANQPGTWITSRLMSGYEAFHRAGYAHSLEVWLGNELVAGIYGVYVGGVFSGESMFHLRSGAGKFALVHLLEFLSSNGLTWMDIQMVTPALRALGGKHIEREDYLRRLETSKINARPIQF